MHDVVTKRKIKKKKLLSICIHKPLYALPADGRMLQIRPCFWPSETYKGRKL